MRQMVDQLEALYRERYTQFCRTAALIAGDRELGRDAVQEAFALAIRKRRRFRAEGSLESWVWKIVINAARDSRRREPVPLRAVVDEGNDSIPSSLLLPLELLTPRQREVLFLHYYADMDYAEIGAALGISPGTVGATLTVARDRLRTALLEEAVV